MINPKILKHFENKPIVFAPLWGLSKLRKRGGIFAGAINGATLWYDQWYGQIMSKQGAEKLAELGINLVVLPFSLGGSNQREKYERDDFSRMTAIYHKLGVKVLPYLQYQNFLQDEHVPNAENWALNADGSLRHYIYWRRTVCQSSDDFKQYFKELFTDAIRRDADGIWIDNNYLHPCYCEKCNHAFRDYLYRNYQYLLQELSLPNFDLVEIPIFLSQHATRDPVVQAYLEFNCQRDIDIHMELKDFLEELSPDALLGSNPALYRGNSYSHRGVDFKRLVELNDLIYLENKLFPEMKGHQLSGNFHGYIACNELGTLAIPGAWKLADFDATNIKKCNGFPEDASEIERAMLEPFTFSANSGGVWTVRTVSRETCTKTEDLFRMYCELPEINQSMKSIIDFMERLPVLHDFENAAEIALLQHRESLMFDCSAHNSALQGAEELMLHVGMPYNIIFSEDIEPKCNKYKLLILPYVTLLSDNEIKILHDYLENGGSLLMIGGSGLYNERFRERIEYPLLNVLDVSSVNLPEKAMMNIYGKGKAAYYPHKTSGKDFINMMSAEADYKRPDWVDDSKNILKIIEQLLDNKPLIRVDDLLGCSFLSNGNTFVIQLFSYDSNPIPHSVTIQTSIGMNSIVSAEVIKYPENDKSGIDIRQEDATTCLCIDGFIRYAKITLQIK